MNPTSWVSILCAALLSGTAALGQVPSILEPKTERRESPPLWISATAVAHAEKILDLDLIDEPLLRNNIEKQKRELGDVVGKSGDGTKPVIATVPPSECKRRIGSADHRGGQDPKASLSDLSLYSRAIIRGKVRAVEPGFSFGEPSSLLAIEISEVLKGPAPKTPFYVDYPIARFRIGPFSFCNLNQGFEPRPGDEILLFDYTGPIDRDDILYAPSLDQVVFQRPGGLLALPPRL